MIFYDTETCGFHSMCVLIQYAENDGDITLYPIWERPVSETLKLIEYFMSQDVCGFNLTFDHFHLCKIYTIFSLIQDKEALPKIAEVAALESQGRDGPCLKPKASVDLMLIAQSGPYQELMNRAPIVIRRVPTVLAYELASELEKRIEIDPIFFAKNKDKTQWKVFDLSDGFSDVKLNFRPSISLKTIAELILGEEDVQHYSDFLVHPVEVGFAPFGSNWPDLIQHHIRYWATSEQARRYAYKDVEYTRKLYYHFNSPAPGDNNSELACQVAASRWKGFAVDIDKIKELREADFKLSLSAPKDPGGAKDYIARTLNPIQKRLLTSTRAAVLEEMAEWNEAAKQVLAARKAKKRVELYDKILKAGRFHASYKIIGTKSSRMAGTDGLNAQGINRGKEIRSCFTLAFENELLCGGDFDAFEVAIAEAEFNDANLREALQSGKKIHALMAMELYPELSYEEILGTEYYSNGKQAVFALLYGGDENTISTRLGIPADIAKKAFDSFQTRYPGIAKARRKIESKFCSMTQPDGLGSKVVWKDPSNYVESFLGFKRYFTLENKVAKALFDMANKMPVGWKKQTGTVKRKDREQSVIGATMSALYAAAFNIQAKNLRAANNHLIQSPGAEITKHLQRRIWDHQPSGVHDWVVRPINVHDEVMCVCDPAAAPLVAETVQETVESYMEKITQIKMAWVSGLKNWGEK
jgi:hypothetical protein